MVWVSCSANETSVHFLTSMEQETKEIQIWRAVGFFFLSGTFIKEQSL